MNWKDHLLDLKKWNKLFKTGQVFAFQFKNRNKLLNSPHISRGNALLYCNFVVLMIFTEKLIYWIKKFFKFAVLEHDQCLWTQVSSFTGILLANWFFESFLIWVCFLTPLPVWYCVLKFSFSRGKAYKHTQRTNYKISGIKIERQENYQLKNTVSRGEKNEDFMVEFCAAGPDSQSNSTSKAWTIPIKPEYHNLNQAQAHGW